MSLNKFVYGVFYRHMRLPMKLLIAWSLVTSGCLFIVALRLNKTCTIVDNCILF